jgi:hypothetical protein
LMPCLPVSSHRFYSLILFSRFSLVSGLMKVAQAAFIKPSSQYRFCCRSFVYGPEYRPNLTFN